MFLHYRVLAGDQTHFLNLGSEDCSEKETGFLVLAVEILLRHV